MRKPKANLAEPVLRQVGKAMPHESAREHVTGAVYTGDLPQRFTNTLHAWPVTAPIACGRVLAFKLADARKTEGFVDVLAAEDAPLANIGPAILDEPLFADEDGIHHIHYWGQPLLWILAETEEAARLAATRVVVETVRDEATFGIEQAIERAQFHAGPFKIETDAPALDALKKASLRFQGELAIGGQEQFYLEGQVAFALFDEAGQCLVHSSTQNPTETQAIVARVLHLPKNEVTCQCLRMGGGFGGKETNANYYAAVAALAARKTGRPVHVRVDRQRDFAMTGKRHPFLARYDVAHDADGLLQALDIELFADGGWSMDLSKPILQRAMFHIDNAYRIPALRVQGTVCKTNTVSHTAFRGFGGPQGMVAIEEVLAQVALRTGLAPEVVRERNLYREGDATHYGKPFEDALRLRQMWTRLLDTSNFAERKQRIEAFNAGSDSVTRGIAMTPVKFGISFTTAFFNQAGALVLMYQDGSVQVNHGGTEMGQGLHTKMRQIAADALGLPLERIRIMPTRTDKVPNTSATAASTGSDLNGQAVRDACRQIRERLANVASTVLGGISDDIVFEDGYASLNSSKDHSISLTDLAKKAYLARVPLFAAGYYRTPHIHFNEKVGRGNPFHYFALGVAVSEVEVERFTGQYKVSAIDILHDVGASLSPLIDRGQVEGGFVQGMGWLTKEEIVWNAEGRITTGGASTYKIPALDDVPEHFNVDFWPKPAREEVLYGSKAVGEPPLMLAISVREALRHAISQHKQDASFALPCPSTPEAVYWALQEPRGEKARDSGSGSGSGSLRHSRQE